MIANQRLDYSILCRLRDGEMVYLAGIDIYVKQIPGELEEFDNIIASRDKVHVQWMTVRNVADGVVMTYENDYTFDLSECVKVEIDW